MHPISPTAAMQMLEAFAQRKLELTRGYYDELFDLVLAALEAANNETFRLRDDPAQEVR